MIHDTLTPQTAERYGALHPLFPQAFDYLLTHREELQQPDQFGRRELLGDDLFVLTGEHALKQPNAAKLEVHDRYIDIQVVLRGRECFGWLPRAQSSLPVGPFNTEKDILFFEDSPSSVATATAGEFVIFFPEDAHAPLIQPGPEDGTVVKAIVKVRVK